MRAHMDECPACRSLVAEVAQDQVPPTRAPDPLERGTVLAGKYRIVEILGSGGMGAVVSAVHEELGQKVAIKVLHGGDLEDRDTVRRFLREGRAAAKLRSDHAVRIYDVGRLPGGAPFLVMEHLDGQDLAAVVRERSLSVDEAVDYILQAIEAIREAHSHGLVHRDIKPANLFLANLSNGETRVKVLDFGLAKDIVGLNTSAFDSAPLTTEHMFIGSPMFMSPEQIRDPRTVDPRTDIWSLGATLWQLVTGQPPFSATSVQSTLAEVVGRKLPPISTVRPGVPHGIEQAIARCMDKDRERRFANVDELATALGGPLRRSSSRSRVEAGPETPRMPSTELMPGVNLLAPTVVDRKEAPLKITAPLPPMSPPQHAARAVSAGGAPPISSRASPGRSPFVPVALIVLLVGLVGGGVFAATKLRASQSSKPEPSVPTVIAVAPSIEPAPTLSVAASAPESPPATASESASAKPPALAKRTPSAPTSSAKKAPPAPTPTRDPIYDP